MPNKVSRNKAVLSSVSVFGDDDDEVSYSLMLLAIQTLMSSKASRQFEILHCANFMQSVQWYYILKYPENIAKV